MTTILTDFDDRADAPDLSAYAGAPCAGAWQGPAPWGTVPARPCAVPAPAELLAGAPFADGVGEAAMAGAFRIVHHGHVAGGADRLPPPGGVQTPATCCLEVPAAPLPGPAAPDLAAPVSVPAALPMMLAAFALMSVARHAMARRRR